jgi:hypothetical protein
MPGSMNSAIKRRQLRFIGNKNTIPNKHPDGNKGGFGPAQFGRAASSQSASGPMSAAAYQGGAPSPSHNIHVHVSSAPDPTGVESRPGVDMQANVSRKRTPPGNAVPPGFSKGAVARRQKG